MWIQTVSCQRNVETEQKFLNHLRLFHLCFNSLVEAFWRGRFAASIVQPCWRVGGVVCVQAFGVTDMLENPGS